MIGGSRDSAQKLGLTYKEPTRWQACDAPKPTAAAAALTQNSQI